MRLPSSVFSLRLPDWNLKIKELLSNISTWHDVVSCYVSMRKSGVLLTDVSLFPALMKASSKLSFVHGQLMHACAVKHGYDSFVSVGNSVLDFYMKWGRPRSALSVFQSLRNRDCVSWNIIIHGYLDQGSLEDGFLFFEQGRLSGFRPNVSTLVLLTQAYRALCDVEGGRKFHCYVLKSGFLDAVSLQNAFLGMYADVDMESAHHLFDKMRERDVISWSMMIDNYVQSDEPCRALQMFKDMEVDPDGFTMASVLKACGNLGDIDIGRSVHASLISRGHYGEVFVSNSTIDMYSRCSDSSSAIQVFHEMSVKNTVSWNLIMSALVNNGMHSKALRLASSMAWDKIEIDEATLLNNLQLCKHFSDPLHCKLIHGRIIRSRYESNPLVLSSLIDAYAKCNIIERAWRLFTGMDEKDTVSWATMIGGFAYCGMAREAISVFQAMTESSNRIDQVVILNLVEACTVSSELRILRWVHGTVIRNGFISNTAVGTAIVDMYSKCGAVEEARKAFNQMQKKNIMSWSTMVSGYGMNGRAGDALALVSEMSSQGLKPNHVTALSVLAACSHGGLVSSGLSFFKEMVEDLGIEPGAEHYACVIDMLSRSGRLDAAMELIEIMPEHLKGDTTIWGSILSSCIRYRKAEIGEGAASKILELDPNGQSGYLLASNLHASTGSWINAAKVRRLVKERGVHVVSGYSSVRLDDKVFRFVAGDKSMPQASKSCYAVEMLHRCMQIDDDTYEEGIER
ncbi:hypothetical protein vseg_018529 [Gypsophila vaccaria]